MLRQSIKRDRERKKASYFIFGLIFLVLIVLSIFPDSLAPFSPSESNYDQLLKKPSKLNLFGTDELGRDILSRIIYGTRVSLSVAVFTSIISLVFGTIYGLFSGIKGGIIDEILMKIVDIFYSIPDLLLISIFILLFGRGTTGIILALSLLSWMRIARITRANVIELKDRPFVLSAKVMGFSDTRIVFKEILPNILAPIIVTFSFTIPSSILAESTLSFLGLGISPPEVSWGLMANNGWQGIRSFPHLIVFPCLAIFISTITFIKIGEFMKEMAE